MPLNSEGLRIGNFLTFSLTKLLNLTGGDGIYQPHAKHNLRRFSTSNKINYFIITESHFQMEKKRTQNIKPHFIDQKPHECHSQI